MELEPILFIPVAIITILISMTFHEAMHGFAAFWQGDDTAQKLGRLTLNPAKHIDPFYTLALPLMLMLVAGATNGSTPVFGAAKPVPFNPYRLRKGELGMALVGLAGPMTNLLLAAMSGLAVRFLAESDGVALQIAAIFTSVNLSFFVFNMIPWPPLDGSRVLFALAPGPVRQLMNQIEQFGLMGFFLLLTIGLPFLSPFIGTAVSVLFELLTGQPIGAIF